MAPKELVPPVINIAVPVHTAACNETECTPAVLVAVQLFVTGLYLPPVFSV
mgnify:CR=1 FL=1